MDETPMDDSIDHVEDPAAHYRAGLNITTMLQRVRELRVKQTPAEQVLWELLRGRRFMGLKFRRQHQYGPYILDFYCAEKSVAVELDGEVHETPEQQDHDRARDNFLRSDGITVVRIANRDLFKDTERSLRAIQEACEAPPSP